MNVSSESEGGRELVLLFGGPGAGKGTQAGLLSTALHIPHISSGDLLRQSHDRAIQDLLTRGDLVPDSSITEVVLERLQQPDAMRGAILDGFPRTLSQAEALDSWLERQGGTIRAAVYLDVPRDELVRRLLERGDVSGRSDDHARVAPRRLQAFLEELPPVLRHYADRSLLRRVDGGRPIDEVYREIMQSLANPAAPAH